MRHNFSQQLLSKPLKGPRDVSAPSSLLLLLSGHFAGALGEDDEDEDGDGGDAGRKERRWAEAPTEAENRQAEV